MLFPKILKNSFHFWWMKVLNKNAMSSTFQYGRHRFRANNETKKCGGANWSHLLPRMSQTPRPSIQETLSGHGLHKSHLESNGDLRRPSRSSIQAVLHHSPRGCFKSSGTRKEKKLQTVNAKDLPRIQKDWISFTWYFIRFEFYRKYLPSILGNPWVHMPLITPYFRKGGYVGR